MNKAERLIVEIKSILSKRDQDFGPGYVPSLGLEELSGEAQFKARQEEKLLKAKKDLQEENRLAQSPKKYPSKDSSAEERTGLFSFSAPKDSTLLNTIQYGLSGKGTPYRNPLDRFGLRLSRMDEFLYEVSQMDIAFVSKRAIVIRIPRGESDKRYFGIAGSERPLSDRSGKPVLNLYSESSPSFNPPPTPQQTGFSLKGFGKVVSSKSKSKSKPIEDETSGSFFASSTKKINASKQVNRWAHTPRDKPSDVDIRLEEKENLRKPGAVVEEISGLEKFKLGNKKKIKFVVINDVADLPCSQKYFDSMLNLPSNFLKNQQGGQEEKSSSSRLFPLQAADPLPDTYRMSNISSISANPTSNRSAFLLAKYQDSCEDLAGNPMRQWLSQFRRQIYFNKSSHLYPLIQYVTVGHVRDAINRAQHPPAEEDFEEEPNQSLTYSQLHGRRNSPASIHNQPRGYSTQKPDSKGSKDPKASQGSKQVKRKTQSPFSHFLPLLEENPSLSSAELLNLDMDISNERDTSLEWKMYLETRLLKEKELKKRLFEEKEEKRLKREQEERLREVERERQLRDLRERELALQERLLEERQQAQATPVNEENQDKSSMINFAPLYSILVANKDRLVEKSWEATNREQGVPLTADDFPDISQESEEEGPNQEEPPAPEDLRTKAKMTKPWIHSLKEKRGGRESDLITRRREEYARNLDRYHGKGSRSGSRSNSREHSACGRYCRHFDCITQGLNYENKETVRRKRLEGIYSEEDEIEEDDQGFDADHHGLQEEGELPGDNNEHGLSEPSATLGPRFPSTVSSIPNINKNPQAKTFLYASERKPLSATFHSSLEGSEPILIADEREELGEAERNPVLSARVVQNFTKDNKDTDDLADLLKHTITKLQCVLKADVPEEQGEEDEEIPRKSLNPRLISKVRKDGSHTRASTSSNLSSVINLYSLPYPPTQKKRIRFSEGC